MNHFIKKCRECGTIIAQCRCPGPGKTVELGVCEGGCKVAPVHFTAGSCRGEKCAMCYYEKMVVAATHKVGEEIPHDDPNPARHNLTAYVCCDHFVMIVGPAAPCVAPVPPLPNLTPKCPACGGDPTEGEFVGDRTVEQICDKCGHKWRKYIPS